MADWLADFQFSGDIWGYPEGEVYFPGSPIVIVESSFGEAVLLETLLLSIYNHDSAIASAASRMTAMAGNRPIIEMGSRRTHELSAVAAARAAYVAGFRRPRTWRRAGVTEYRRAALQHIPSPCSTLTSGKRSRHKSPSWAREPHCSWIPTTSSRP